MVRAALIAALALTAGAASAQSSDTNCSQIGQQFNCHTQQNNGINWGLLNQRPAPQPDYLGSLRAATEIAAQRRAAQQAQQDQVGRDNEAFTRQMAAAEAHDRNVAAGKLIAAGRCLDAKAYALNAGDLDLASKVAALCEGQPRP